MREKTIFTFSFPVTLTFDQICSSRVTLVQRYVSNKLEISSLSCEKKIGRTARTDGRTKHEVQRLMRPQETKTSQLLMCVMTIFSLYQYSSSQRENSIVADRYTENPPMMPLNLATSKITFIFCP